MAAAAVAAAQQQQQHQQPPQQPPLTQNASAAAVVDTKSSLTTTTATPPKQPPPLLTAATTTTKNNGTTPSPPSLKQQVAPTAAGAAMTTAVGNGATPPPLPLHGPVAKPIALSQITAAVAASVATQKRSNADDDSAFLDAIAEFQRALEQHPNAANNGVAGLTSVRVLKQAHYSHCAIVQFDVRAALPNGSMSAVYASYLSARTSPIGKVLLSRDEAFYAMLVALYALLKLKKLDAPAEKLVERVRQKPPHDAVSAELATLTEALRAETDLIRNPVWIRYLADDSGGGKHVVEVDFDALYDPTLWQQ